MAALYIFVLSMALLYPQQAYSDVPEIVVENSEAYIGSNATIPCRYSPPTSSRISWRLSSDRNDVTLVSSVNPVNGRFSLLSEENGNCTLHISSFKRNDSNTYTVTVGSGDLIGHGSANLSTAYRTEIHIEDDVVDEGEVVELFCNIQPDAVTDAVTWYHGNKTIDVDDRYTQSDDLNILMIKTAVSSDAGIYSCQIEADGKVTPSWNQPSLKVNYIRFEKTEYHHHKAVCEVTSYPSPATVNLIVDSQILKSGENKVEFEIPEEAVNISCNATTSSGQYSIHYFDDEDDEDDDAPISPIAIIGIILGGGAVLIIIGLVLFYVFRNKGKEQTPKQETREVKEDVTYKPVPGDEGGVSM
ncbi:uncharacterized protein LOC117100999 [Anneissia japonica]|uniref:uncharacterized protein LOC117100999 n=1 Tax=Anneissia japonica TaxID=1529436 RepID=UPI001425A263|nr:uncharacterized protein LOC117100999 [Anneissia japonica]